MRIFITGGTGLVGSRLIRALLQRGDTVAVLTRRPDAAYALFGQEATVVSGDPMRAGDWMGATADCDAIVHLAGENVFAHRWSESIRQLLHDSRVLSTENIVKALAKQPCTAAGQPKVLVNASAIGYYGPCGGEELAEDGRAGDDFLARLCIDWEKAARVAETHQVRVTIVRVGVVLDKQGGALKAMLTPFKLGLGGRTGSGRQWVSWIHHVDMVGILLLALESTKAKGPINATSPNPLPNREFAKALGRALHRPAFMPTPAFALRVMLGQVSQLVTTGQRVLPRRALFLGYTFRFPTIDAALADILA
jgi:uncharacterized protein (TIGR01777 family)